MTTDRFYSNVKKTKYCWYWESAKTSRGYGQFRLNGKTVYAHRFIMGFPSGEVMHKCDNPSCVNPKHLTVGTHKENMAQMSLRGRSPRGEKCGTSKLKQRQVYEIRSIYASGLASQNVLSRKYGVGQDQISRIINYKRWTN